MPSYVSRSSTDKLFSDSTAAIEPTQINLFFIANNASHKFDELKHDSNVNVSFYDQNTSGWASVSGIAKVSQDKELIKKFWSSMFVLLSLKRSLDCYLIIGLGLRLSLAISKTGNTMGPKMTPE